MQWLVMSLALYFIVGWVRSTIEKGKRRSLRAGSSRRSKPSRDERRGPASAREKRAPERPPARPPHEVLGLDEDAPLEVIQARYKKLAVEYHPDKLAKSAPELQKIAGERLREINAAYAELVRSRRDD